jgi:predicted RecB family endonuclease
LDKLIDLIPVTSKSSGGISSTSWLSWLDYLLSCARDSALAKDDAKHLLESTLNEKSDRFKDYYQALREDINNNYVSLVKFQEDISKSLPEDTLKSATEWKAWARNLAESKKKSNLRYLETIKHISNNLQDEVSNFEAKFKVDISSILRDIYIYTCPNCKSIISIEKFELSHCACGEKINKPSEAEHTALRSLYDSIKKIYDNNIWYEEGIAYVLKRDGYVVFTSYNVMGGSGIFHEVDVIAERSSPPTRMFVECKTGLLSVNQIFALAGKMRDTGVASGLLCTTEKEANPEIVKAAKVNGITVVYDTLDKDADFWTTTLARIK